jgi:hypothetical protein
MAVASRLPGEVVIGVVGPQQQVEQVLLSAAAVEFSDAPRRLVPVVCRYDEEAPDQAARACGRVDVCMYAGPAPYHYARKAGPLAIPVTHVALSGSALYAALLRSAGRYDLERVSLDVLSRPDVEEAYAELGIATGKLRLSDDDAPDVARAVPFHRRQWELGATSVALTCISGVERRLASYDVPVMTVRPTAGAIRCALRTAALLARQHRLQSAQFTLAVVEVPALRTTLSRYEREELKLTVHRFLVQEAGRMQTVVSPADDHTFVITSTRQAMASAGDPPFAGRALAELGVVLEVGVGTGSTVAEAEINARRVMRRAAPGAGTEPKSMELLATLAGLLPDDKPPVVVDADHAAELLDVTPRTARRLLHALSDDGLAWPLPTGRPGVPGRPRQQYRLITERLDYPPASS